MLLYIKKKRTFSTPNPFWLLATTKRKEVEAVNHFFSAFPSLTNLWRSLTISNAASGRARSNAFCDMALNSSALGPNQSLTIFAISLGDLENTPHPLSTTYGTLPASCQKSEVKLLEHYSRCLDEGEIRGGKKGDWNLLFTTMMIIFFLICNKWCLCNSQIRSNYVNIVRQACLE